MKIKTSSGKVVYASSNMYRVLSTVIAGRTVKWPEDRGLPTYMVLSGLLNVNEKKYSLSIEGKEVADLYEKARDLSKRIRKNIWKLFIKALPGMRVDQRDGSQILFKGDVLLENGDVVEGELTVNKRPGGWYRAWFDLPIAGELTPFTAHTSSSKMKKKILAARKDVFVAEELMSE